MLRRPWLDPRPFAALYSEQDYPSRSVQTAGKRPAHHVAQALLAKGRHFIWR